MIDIEKLQRIARDAFNPALTGIRAIDAQLEFQQAFTPTAMFELCAEMRRLKAILDTPILTAAYAPYIDGVAGLEGINRDVAQCAFAADAREVTVYYGEKRVYTTMAEFDAATRKKSA